MSGMLKIYYKGESLGVGNKIDCKNVRWDLKSMLAWPMKEEAKNKLIDRKYTP